MSNHRHKYFEDDVWAWAIIVMIFGAVNLALWAALIWQFVHG